MDDGTKQVAMFPIGMLADQFNVTAATIRNWEGKRLIPPAIRTLGHHRRYTQVHIDAISKAMKLPKVAMVKA